MSDYTPSGNPISLSRGIAKIVRDEFVLIQTAVNSKADLASPALTGTPTAPTAAPGTNNTQIATTAYADAGIVLKADLASPALTGTPTAPTAAANNNSTQIATTAYVDTADALKANLASPALTGVPTAPTAAASTNTTQIATTAFVIAESISGTVPVTAPDEGKLFVNDGTIASWGTKFNTTVNDFADGTDDTKVLTLDLTGISAGTTRTLTIPNATTTMVGTNVSQTLTNKTLTLPVIDVSDASFTLQDNADSTKKAAFELSGISTSTTRTFTLPNANTTLVGTGVTQTLTNKTLTSPVIDVSDASFTLQDNADATKEARFQLSGITTGNTRVITLLDADTTMVGTTTTQTLTNKTLTLPTITVADNAFTLQDNSVSTKKAVFQLSGITAGNTRTITLPDTDLTLSSPGWELLDTVTSAGASQMDIEWTAGSHDSYFLVATNMKTADASADRLDVRFKIGGSYLSTSTYQGSYTGGQVGTVPSFSSFTTQPTAFLTLADITNATDPANVILRLYNTDDTGRHAVDLKSTWSSVTPSRKYREGVLSNTTAGAISGVRFLTFSGSNVSGTLRLFGVRD